MEKDKSSLVFMTLDEVVKAYSSRITIQDYHKDIVEMAKYYGAAVLQEATNLVITEDAEVVSVETVVR